MLGVVGTTVACTLPHPHNSFSPRSPTLTIIISSSSPIHSRGRQTRTRSALADVFLPSIRHRVIHRVRPSHLSPALTLDLTEVSSFQDARHRDARRSPNIARLPSLPPPHRRVRLRRSVPPHARPAARERRAREYGHLRPGTRPLFQCRRIRQLTLFSYA